jgi:hypothetical protein
VHWLPAHLEFTHENEQQSVPAEQDAPAAPHTPGSRAQMWEIGSQ